MADSIFPDESETSLARGSFPGGTSWSAEASCERTRDVLFPLFGPSDPLYPRDEPAAIVNPFDVTELVRQGHWYSAISAVVPALWRETLSLPVKGRLLDLACGVADLLMHLCALHPTCTFVGMDVSPDLLRYVRARAKGEGRDKVVFVLHNIHEPLPSDLAPFHWICGRFLGSILSKGNYLDLLSRANLHLLAGGKMHLVECLEGYSSSAAFGELHSLYLNTILQFGFFEAYDLQQESQSPTRSVEVFLREAGYAQVSSQQVYLPLRHPLCVNYLRLTAHQLIDFLLRVGTLSPESGRRLYESIEEDLCSGSLRGYFLIESASGSCPIRSHHTGSDHLGERQELREG